MDVAAFDCSFHPSFLPRCTIPVFLLNVTLKRSRLYGPAGSFVCLTRYKPSHDNLLLYGGRAPFTIKTHRSRGAVRPDLEAGAIARLLLNGVRWLSPDGPDFVGRHADARLCGRSG